MNCLRFEIMMALAMGLGKGTVGGDEGVESSRVTPQEKVRLETVRRPCGAAMAVGVVATCSDVIAKPH